MTKTWTAQSRFLRSLLTGAFLLASLLTLPAGQTTCEVCGKIIRDGGIFLMKDLVREVKKYVCQHCTKSEHNCKLCGLPIPGDDFTDLGDGRVYCAEDSKDLVLADAQGEPLILSAKVDLQRILAQWPPLPDRDISLRVLKQKEFINAHRDDPNTPDPEGWLGVTQSRTNRNATWTHKIFILAGLPASQFIAVAAHETAHVWLAEHGRRITSLHPEAREGFCEFIAYLVMRERGFPQEMKRIERNGYSRGQIDAFIKADAERGFHRVIDWVLNGVDRYLDVDKMDRLLVLQPEVKPLSPFHQPSTLSPPATFAVAAAPIVMAPDRLILKGITRAGRSSLALINNRTLGIGEEGKVHIGESNVVVRCLAIKDGEVTVQIVGSLEKQRLFMPGP